MRKGGKVELRPRLTATERGGVRGRVSVRGKEGGKLRASRLFFRKQFGPRAARVSPAAAKDNLPVGSQSARSGPEFAERSLLDGPTTITTTTTSSALTLETRPRRNAISSAPRRFSPTTTTGRIYEFRTLQLDEVVVLARMDTSECDVHRWKTLSAPFRVFITERSAEHHRRKCVVQECLSITATVRLVDIDSACVLHQNGRRNPVPSSKTKVVQKIVKKKMALYIMYTLLTKQVGTTLWARPQCYYISTNNIMVR